MSARITDSSGRRESTQLEEKKEGEGIPQSILDEARRDVEKFYKNEIPNASLESITWVQERFAPAMAEAKWRKAHVSEAEAQAFLIQLKTDIANMTSLIDNVNFSRGHELEKNSYPSVADFKPLAEWIESLADSYDHFHQVSGFKNQFQKSFTFFLKPLMEKVKVTALASLSRQLEQLKLRANDADLSFELAVIPAHIAALNSKPEQPLLELRDLLNLSRIPRLDREPSMQEQRAFGFLWQIFHELEKQKS